MTGQRVNVDNFRRAETHRMFAGLQRDAGGINRFMHNREPAPVDQQTVIRMNRDTLYSFGIIDLSDGATLTVPEAGGRYLSVMVVNEDHYVNRVFHEAGTYDLTVEEFDSPYVAVAARTLVDPHDPHDPHHPLDALRGKTHRPCRDDGIGTGLSGARHRGRGCRVRGFSVRSGCQPRIDAAKNPGVCGNAGRR